MLGGTENYYFGDEKSLKNDVWSSADGKEWKQETVEGEAVYRIVGKKSPSAD